MASSTRPGHSNGETTAYLTGQCLIAMPGMPDKRFARTVILVCSHNEDGALGIVINRLVDDLDFPELCERLSIDVTGVPATRAIHFGGPVETGRGFVLHTMDYNLDEATLWVRDDIGLTATLDVVKAMASGDGPKRALLALGYAGWAPGQLETEIQANGWLHCDADLDLIFGKNVEASWERAFTKLGIAPGLLSSSAGHA